MGPSADQVESEVRQRAAATAPEEARLRIWVVPHTHWDREWYLPFEQLRIRLARVVDDLLDILERQPDFVFTLDGQTVVLEDYLEVRPEREERLRRHLASGRIAVGPWYVLADEFLVGQESLIRNLLMGRLTCARLGALPMAVGYAPDTFGHVAQLPQILRGFGIDSFVFWRGLGDEADRLGAVFHWQAPNGSRVLAVRMLGSYASARDLGRWTSRDGSVLDRPDLWPDTAARRVLEFLERWGEPIRRSGLRDVLLSNGNDHQPAQGDLLEMLAACRARIPWIDFHVATFEGYVDALRWRLGELQQHAGELLGGREACVVRGVNSTRMYLKQANEATERALMLAESLAALAWLRARPSPIPPSGPSPARGWAPAGRPGYRYPLDELRLAWRELLRNHPHDSLPGCSVDEVHLDMQQRFRSARQIAHHVQREALAALAGKVAGPRPWEDPGGEWSLVNVLPWERTGVVELDLPPSLQKARDVVAETAEGPCPAQIAGSGGERRALVVVPVPGFGARDVRLRRGTAQPFPSRAAALDCRTIENEHYRVHAALDGTLVVTDRSTGESWSGLHRFLDEADRGDEYSFCPLEGDRPWDSRQLAARVRVRAAGPAVAELEIALPARLPRELRSDRKARARSTVPCPIRTVVRLAAGVDRIELRTIVENRARDHRLRVLFPAPVSDRFVRVEGHFALLRRPAEPVWNGQWREPPARTNHTLGLVSAGKLALMSRGLPEYEAIPHGSGVMLALTLLRCVGWLGRPDLSTRPGADEPQIPTPDAQCPGTHTFEYAISLRGQAEDAALLRAAHDYRTDLAVGPMGVALDGALRLEGDGFAFAALKGAEDGDGVILRLYNPAGAPTPVRVVAPGLAARRCQMDESGTEPEPVETVSIGGGEIVTLRIAERQG